MFELIKTKLLKYQYCKIQALTIKLRRQIKTLKNYNLLL